MQNLPFIFDYSIYSQKQGEDFARFFGLLRIYELYHKVASTNTSRSEAHAGFFRLLMKGIVDSYVLWPFDKKLILSLSSNAG